MRLHIFLLFGQILLYLPQVDHFPRFLASLTKRSLNLPLKLLQFALVAIYGLTLHAFCLSLVLDKFAVPVVVELGDFLDMGHFHLPLLLFESHQQFFLTLAFELLLDLGESAFSGFRLHVLAGLLAVLLVGVEHLPGSSDWYMYYSRVPPSNSGRATRLMRFSFPTHTLIFKK
jgi:hypothetical protein